MSYLAPFLHGGFFYVVVFLAVLTVLVFVHELGHYLIARRNGVRVEVFSIGFGPELFGWWDRAGTRWKFSAIPLGGYVKMFGDSDASSGLPIAGLGQLTAAEREVSFHCKRLGQRAAIVAGGPIANFLFAIVVLAVLFMTFGQPFTPAEIGKVTPGSAAEQSGMRPGDIILSINDQLIERFEDVQLMVRLNPNAPMAIVVRRDGAQVPLTAKPSGQLGVFTPAQVGQVAVGSAAAQSGFEAGDEILSVNGRRVERFEDIEQMVRFHAAAPMTIIVQRHGAPVTLNATPTGLLGIVAPPKAGQVLPGGAGEKAGVRSGDLFLSVNGQNVESAKDVQRIASLHPGVPIAIVVQRSGEQVALTATPAAQLGISPSGVETVRRDPFTAVVRAVGETWNLSVTTLGAVGQMVIGTRTTEELGGPLRIAQLSGEVAQGGIVPLLWFMAVLSINLGLINLFPVPVLDGGHLLFYAAEAIRGKPLGQRTQEYGFRVGLALVLTLMVFATWNDLVHTGLVDFVKRFVT
jgi:regulator of sigma E protease